MKQEEYNRKTEIIAHMNALMRHLSDEEAQMAWLTYGVPDGSESFEAIRECYPNDEGETDGFGESYDELVRLFVSILKSETKDKTLAYEGTKGLFW